MPIDREVWDGIKHGVLAGAAVLAVAWPYLRPGHGAVAATPGHAAAPAASPGMRAMHANLSLGGPAAPGVAAPLPAEPPAIVRRLDLHGEQVSPAVMRLTRWVVGSADNGTMPFVVIDKKNARIFVFDASGKLLGSSAVLLGYAAGDDTVPGIGDRPIADVRPFERTTPAGRFVAEPGRNAHQQDVVWVDYDAALSMHRVITSNPEERRPQRLATPTSADNRISYGCINLPPSFFDRVLFPQFRSAKGVVYILPEVKTLAEVFPGVDASVKQAGAAPVKATQVAAT